MGVSFQIGRVYNTVVENEGSGARLPRLPQLCHLKKYEIASVSINSSFSSMEDNGFTFTGSFNCRDGVVGERQRGRRMRKRREDKKGGRGKERGGEKRRGRYLAFWHTISTQNEKNYGELWER